MYTYTCIHCILIHVYTAYLYMFTLHTLYTYTCIHCILIQFTLYTMYTYTMLKVGTSHNLLIEFYINIIAVFVVYLPRSHVW